MCNDATDQSCDWSNFIYMLDMCACLLMCSADYLAVIDILMNTSPQALYALGILILSLTNGVMLCV